MIEKNISCISGLYFYVRSGISSYPYKIISEIKRSIQLNPWYKHQLICYADSREMADILSSLGLYVHKVLDDAPELIKVDSAHKMKHWIMFQAAQEFKNVLWIDWDTYSLKKIDSYFISWCTSSENPKFTYIPHYWAIVNCSVYYLSDSYLDLMEKSFYAHVPIPNDELLWRSVLGDEILSIREYWLWDMVINVWEPSDLGRITNNTYFLHLKDFDMIRFIEI